MYHHIKKLMYTVRVGKPDPRFGNMLLEQFGGANGELAAAMQYSIQGLNCTDPARKDLLMDIGTEEFEPFGNCWDAGADASPAHEKVARSGGGRSVSCDCGRWWRNTLQFNGEPLDSGLFEDNRGVGCGSAQRYRSGGAGENCL